MLAELQRELLLHVQEVSDDGQVQHDEGLAVDLLPLHALGDGLAVVRAAQVGVHVVHAPVQRVAGQLQLEGEVPLEGAGGVPGAAELLELGLLGVRHVRDALVARRGAGLRVAVRGRPLARGAHRPRGALAGLLLALLRGLLLVSLLVRALLLLLLAVDAALGSAAALRAVICNARGGMIERRSVQGQARVRVRRVALLTEGGLVDLVAGVRAGGAGSRVVVGAEERGAGLQTHAGGAAEGGHLRAARGDGHVGVVRAALQPADTSALSDRATVVSTPDHNNITYTRAQ